MNSTSIIQPKYLILLIGVSALFMIFILFLRSQGAPSDQDESPNLQEEGVILSGSFDSSRLKSDQEWKNILTSQQYHILREAGTEYAFTGALDNEERAGTYYSVGCDIPLFRSEQKYDSGTGWPSFWAPIEDDAVVLRQESGFGKRIEVLDRCGGHLGHVFDDGPDPTGKTLLYELSSTSFCS